MKRTVIGYGIFLVVVGGALVLAPLETVITLLGIVCTLLGLVMIGTAMVKD